MKHELKCWPEPYQAILSGEKRFELRKNDRGFEAGDVLYLREWNPDTGYTGRSCEVVVIWELTKFEGLEPGYCIMSVSLPVIIR